MTKGDGVCDKNEARDDQSVVFNRPWTTQGTPLPSLTHFNRYADMSYTCVLSWDFSAISTDDIGRSQGTTEMHIFHTLVSSACHSCWSFVWELFRSNWHLTAGKSKLHLLNDFGHILTDQLSVWMTRTKATPGILEFWISGITSSCNFLHEMPDLGKRHEAGGVRRTPWRAFQDRESPIFSCNLDEIWSHVGGARVAAFAKSSGKGIHARYLSTCTVCAKV